MAHRHRGEEETVRQPPHRSPSPASMSCLLLRSTQFDLSKQPVGSHSQVWLESFQFVQVPFTQIQILDGSSSSNWPYSFSSSASHFPTSCTLVNASGVPITLKASPKLLHERGSGEVTLPSLCLALGAHLQPVTPSHTQLRPPQPALWSSNLLSRAWIRFVLCFPSATSHLLRGNPTTVTLSDFLISA